MASAPKRTDLENYGVLSFHPHTEIIQICNNCLYQLLTPNFFELDTLPDCAAITWSRNKIMRDALSWHQVLIKPSIFPKQRASSASARRSLRSSTSYFCSDSAAMRWELETSPSAMPECCTSFVVVTPLSIAPSLSFNFSLSPQTPSPRFSTSCASPLPWAVVLGWT